MVILVNSCNRGAYVRWYMNGWHHYLFNDRYQIVKTYETKGTQTLERFSDISRIEIPTGIKVKTWYELGTQGISGLEFEGLKGILYAEYVQIYIDEKFWDVEVERSSFKVRDNKEGAFDVMFKVELKNLGQYERTLVIPAIDADEVEPPAPPPALEPYNVINEDFTGVAPYGWLPIYSSEGTLSTVAVTGSAAKFAVNETITFNDRYFGIVKPFSEITGRRVKITVGISGTVEPLTGSNYLAVGANPMIRIKIIGATTDGEFDSKLRHYEYIIEPYEYSSFIRVGIEVANATASTNAVYIQYFTIDVL
jgi:hypothetical protein